MSKILSFIEKMTYDALSAGIVIDSITLCKRDYQELALEVRPFMLPVLGVYREGTIPREMIYTNSTKILCSSTK